MPDEPAPGRARPKNAVVILLDSLNWHMLGSYGGTEFATPNLDHFASQSLHFESTTPARCRACPPVTTGSAGRSIFSGDREVRTSPTSFARPYNPSRGQTASSSAWG